MTTSNLIFFTSRSTDVSIQYTQNETARDFWSFDNNTYNTTGSLGLKCS